MRRHKVACCVAATLVLAGCTVSESPEPTPTETPSPTVTETPSPEVTDDVDPVSLPAMFDEDITGGDLEYTGEIEAASGYSSHTVTYRSGDLTVSGVLNVPAGDGPFPAIVLNHGYIDPAVYVTGQGMSRERDYLAREGFVVLHTDYRGHAESDPAEALDLELRLGYTRDAIAGVRALRDLPEVDPDRVAMGGRSMGGGVTFNALVVDPDLVGAAVVWASVSTLAAENFEQWTEDGRPEVAQEIVDRWGSPEDDPDFWAGISSRTYLDRIETPVMMHHGTADESCPYVWAEQTRDALSDEGADVTFHAYEGERHAFEGDWELSMQRTVDFLRTELD